MRERPEKRRKGRGRFREGGAGNVEEGPGDERGASVEDESKRYFRERRIGNAEMSPRGE